jgi:hypothetical protein
MIRPMLNSKWIPLFALSPILFLSGAQACQPNLSWPGLAERTVLKAAQEEFGTASVTDVSMKKFRYRFLSEWSWGTACPSYDRAVATVQFKVDGKSCRAKVTLDRETEETVSIRKMVCER